MSERDAGWPQRSGKVVLQLGLRQLARHYGLLRDGATGKGAARIRHWGETGYRPTLEDSEQADDGVVDQSARQ